jgi:ATP/maltotriose-dependent transcriptional regulator MalT
MTWISVMALLEGRLADAERSTHEALALIQRGLSQDATMFFTALVLTLRRERGQLRELAEMMPAANALAEKFPSVAIVRSALALLYSYLGEERVARHELDYLAENDFADLHRDWTWLPNLAILAEVCAFLGDSQRAAKLYDLLLPYGERNVVSSSAPGVVARHLGLLATTMGLFDDAAAHYETALRLNERMGARVALVHTLQAYGAMLLTQSGRTSLGRARQLLERALAISDEVGMTYDAEQIRSLLAERRLSAVAHHDPGYPNGLSEREVEVLRLIAAGRSNREIAAELVLSVRTVERHITNIYGKIDARGKADATAYALNHGLTQPRLP